MMYSQTNRNCLATHDKFNELSTLSTVNYVAMIFWGSILWRMIVIGSFPKSNTHVHIYNNETFDFDIHMDMVGHWAIGEA